MASSSTDSKLSKRRRFQPPITSFFVSAGSSGHDDYNENKGLSHDNYSVPTHTPTPALPAKIQSSLLTVGMRIRKSVPEGYKTEQTKPTSFSGYGPKACLNASISTPYSQAERAFTELLPFSGMHKVGNYAVQTFPRPLADYQDKYRPNAAYMDDGDIHSLPSSSQESNVSSIVPVNLNKRSYDSDDGDECAKADRDTYTSSQPIHDKGIWQDPLRSNPVFKDDHHISAISKRPTRRPILSPKCSQQRQQYVSFTSSSSHKLDVDQENVGPEYSYILSVKHDMDVDDMDFGEAPFLRRPEEVDYKCRSWCSEIEMGG